VAQEFGLQRAQVFGGTGKKRHQRVFQNVGFLLGAFKGFALQRWVFHREKLIMFSKKREICR